MSNFKTKGPVLYALYIEGKGFLYATECGPNYSMNPDDASLYGYDQAWQLSGALDKSTLYKVRTTTKFKLEGKSVD